MTEEKKSSKKSTLATKYLIIGIFLTLFNYALYTLIARLIIKNDNLLWLSTLISTFITTFVAYALHSRITWKERNPGKLGIIKFLLWNFSVALAIGPFLTWLFGLITPLYDLAFNISTAMHLPFDYSFVHSTGAFVLTSIITMILNFLFYDKIVFGKKKEEKEEKEEE